MSSEGGEMEICACEDLRFCDECRTTLKDKFSLDIGGCELGLCFSCVIKLRDLCHEATCEKDVTGKCDCWEGER